MAESYDAEAMIPVRVVEPKDDCNLYTYEPHRQTFLLSGIYRVAQPSFVDRAVAVDLASGTDLDIPVLLMSHRAILPGCIVNARPIALLRLQGSDGEDRYVIAEPVVEPADVAVRALADLPAEQLRALQDFVNANLDGESSHTLLWEDGPSAMAFIHEVKRADKLARAQATKPNISSVAWKPLGYRAAGARRAADIEPHTESEYAYHQLPYRFQHYVDEYLAPDERILFAVNRPAMKSALRRDWLKRGETLQAGIMFVTDQQVALVTEIIPPDQSSIRYGYIVHAGIPERIGPVNVKPIADSACLEFTWRAATGVERVLWEFPCQAAGELQAAAELLHGWQPRVDDRRLRRAYGSPPLEIDLRDPSANNPEAIIPLITRLTDALQAQLMPGEQVLARLLIPGWANADRLARILAVSDQRVLVVPDPLLQQIAIQEIHLRDVSSVMLKSSILDSWLLLRITENDQTRSVKIGVPSTAPGFELAFQALRQQLVAVPVT